MKSLLAISALFLSTALAEPADTYQLDLMIYATDSGHKLALGTYIASFRVPMLDERECLEKGEAALKAFKGSVLPDRSRTLPAYACERVP